MGKLITGVVLVCISWSLASGQVFYGTTVTGGTGGGTIFKANLDGTGLTTEHSFTIASGMGRNGDYSQMVKAPGGKLYGALPLGGLFDKGVLFEYDPGTNTYTKKIDFVSNAIGLNPNAGLAFGPNGHLYGTCTNGGAFFGGTIFEYDIAANTVIKRADFEYANTGGTVFAGLVLAANGMFYGVTFQGGAHDDGVLFQFNPATNVLTKKIDFDGTTKGGWPLRRPMRFSGNDKLYGTTINGGANSMGIVYEFDPATDLFTKRFDFDGASAGQSPVSTMIEVSGKLYGTTSNGGVNNAGVLFEFDPGSGVVLKKHDFNDVPTGRGDLNILTVAAGILYGTTEYGGTANGGVLFEFNPGTNAFIKRHDFSGLTGFRPKSGLTLADNGKLYGTTAEGGSTESGVMFEFNPATNVYTKKFDFNVAPNGIYPVNSSLVQASNGKLYGSTTDGGSFGWGVLFQFDPLTKAYATTVDFDNSAAKGANPSGRLAVHSNGKIYGTTRDGGTSNLGTIFEYDPVTHTLIKKVDFDGLTKGSIPWGGLTLAANGKYYGLTRFGGVNDMGVIFEFDPGTGVFVLKASFLGGVADGREPHGEIVVGVNGKLYGLTRYGGATDNGVLFEYELTGTKTVKVHLDGTGTGRFPMGSMINGADGKLYGLTSDGGAFGGGTLFSYSASATIVSNLHDFDFAAFGGTNPQSTLTLGAGNKLYGFTTYGGTNGAGTLFEFNPVNSAFSYKHNFALTDGASPLWGALSVVAVPPVVTSFLPAAAAVGATVTITGQNFSTTPSNNIVRFGPVQATVSTATPTQLTVVVPHGAETAPITVTTSNLTGRSRTSFSPTYTFNGWIPGSFYSRTDLIGATNDKRSVIADLDGDGLPDAIQVSEGVPGSVHVFRNASSPSTISFEAKLDFPVNRGYSVAVEDLDGDGKLDIIVASGVSDGLSILRNTSTVGSISFDAQVDLVVPASGMISIATADFDGDGKPDLVGGGATSIHIYKNLSVVGSLAFSGVTSLSGGVPGATIWKIAVGDIDGDSNIDIAIPVPGVTLAATNVAVFRNLGIKGTIDGGSFAAPVQFSAPGYSAGVELGDLDGDGKPELVVGSTTDFNSLLVRLNTATPGVIDAGTFGPAISLGTPKQMWDPKIADVDGDGKPEILCGITSNGTILIYKNLITAAGTISANSFSRYSIVTEGAPLSVNVADMNSDGFPDLIVGNEGSNRISIFKNSNVVPPPSIVSFTPLSGPVGASVTITGTNFSSTPGLNSTYFGATKATVTASTPTSLTVTIPAGASYAPLSVAVNGQIAYSSKPFSPAFVTSGTITAGSFATKTDIVAGTNPQIFSIGDFDVDGKPDVAVANINANSMSVLRNTSTVGSISLGKVDFATGLQPYGLASADIDGEGKLDIGVANVGGSNISLFRNTSTSGAITSGSFAAKVDVNTAGDAFSIAMADMDQDGRVDQVVTNLNTASLVIFKNIAGQLPYVMSTTVVGLKPSHVSLGDLDGDRMPEMVVTNFQPGSTISIFRNRNEIGSLAWDLFEKTDITVGAIPYSTALVDLDADGKLDIVVANNTGGTISVLKNVITATGSITSSSFAGKVDFIVGANPNLVTAADLDGDLKPEIITSNDGSASISVLKNLMAAGSDVTAASFQAKVDFTVGAAPRDVHAADIDGDGKPEILATSEATNSISILRNISSLAAPVINAVDQLTSTGFRIVWTAAPGAVDYRVDISSDNFATMVPGYDNLVASGTSLTATGLSSGTTHKFRVRSANASGVSPNSVETTVLTIPAPPVISPTELITTTGFKIVWVAAVGAASYRVDISTDNFVTMVTGYDNLTISATSVTVAGLSPGTTYKFRVRVVNASGISANSVETTVATVPAAPVATAASAISQTGFTANWAASAGSADYRLDVSVDDFATNLSSANNLLVTGLSQVVTGLTASTPYKYRVRAANASGASANSNVISVATTPPVPGITSFTPQVGNIGTVVNITGTNFDPVLANNVVRFNGTQATVTSDATTTSIKATVPTGATTGKITITVAGQVGTSANDFVVDTTPPQILNNTATSVNAGAALSITATIADVESDITSYTLSYASLSSSAALTAGTLTKSGNTYTGTVPSTSIGENGVEYVLTATNGAGLVTTVTATAQVSMTGDGLNIPYTAFGSGEANYRIIAVPLDLTNKTVADVFEDDLAKSTKKNWRITKYGVSADTELTSASPIEPKVGYWLIVKDNPNKAIDTGPGKSVATSRTAPVEIQLNAGWNQIGNPFNFKIVWSEVMSASTGVVLGGAPRTYRGTWADGSIINAMEGFFVNSPSIQVLKIPAAKNAAANGKTMDGVISERPISEAGWRVYLELTQGRGRNKIAGVGMEKDALTGSDTYDGLTMPRFFERYLEVNHSKRTRGDAYSMDIVPTAPSHVWEFDVETNYEDELLRFEWNSGSFGDNDKTLVLWDEQLQLGIDMRTISHHEFRKSASMRFKVFFGDQDQVNDLAIAERLVFHEVYPNPAESDATVSFSIPQSGEVNFDVFDASGRRVWSQSGAYARGRHEVGLSGIKTSAGAGLFIIQVSSEGSRQQKRLQIR